MIGFSDILDQSRRVNLKTLRVISLFLIIFSHTPLASIWLVFCSWAFRETGESSSSSPPRLENAFSHEKDKIAPSALIRALHNATTLDELLTLFLRHRSNTFGLGGANALAYQWAAAVPWMLSLIFGFVIPAMLYILSLIRSRRLQQQRSENHYSDCRKRRRRKKILAILSDYTMVRLPT